MRPAEASRVQRVAGVNGQRRRTEDDLIRESRMIADEEHRIVLSRQVSVRLTEVSSSRATTSFCTTQAAIPLFASPASSMNGPLAADPCRRILGVEAS